MLLLWKHPYYRHWLCFCSKERWFYQAYLTLSSFLEVAASWCLTGQWVGNTFLMKTEFKSSCFWTHYYCGNDIVMRMNEMIKYMRILLRFEQIIQEYNHNAVLSSGKFFARETWSGYWKYRANSHFKSSPLRLTTKNPENYANFSAAEIPGVDSVGNIFLLFNSRPQGLTFDVNEWKVSERCSWTQAF